MKTYKKESTALVKRLYCQVHTDDDTISKIKTAHLEHTPQNYQTFLKENNDFYRVATSLHFKERILLCVDIDFQKNKKIKNINDFFSQMKTYNEKYNLPNPTYVNRHSSGNLSVQWLLESPVKYYDENEKDEPKVSENIHVLKNSRLGIMYEKDYSIDTNPLKSKQYRLLTKLLNTVLFEGDTDFTGWVTRNPYYDGKKHFSIFMQENNIYSINNLSKVIEDIAKDLDYGEYLKITDRIGDIVKDEIKNLPLMKDFIHSIDIIEPSKEVQKILSNWKIKVKSDKRKLHRYNAVQYFFSKKIDLTESELTWLVLSVMPAIERYCRKDVRHSTREILVDIAKMYAEKHKYTKTYIKMDENTAIIGRGRSLLTRKLQKLSKAWEIRKYKNLSSRKVAEILGISFKTVSRLRTENIDFILTEDEISGLAELESTRGLSSYVYKNIEDKELADKFIRQAYEFKFNYGGLGVSPSPYTPKTQDDFQSKESFGKENKREKKKEKTPFLSSIDIQMTHFYDKEIKIC